MRISLREILALVLLGLTLGGLSPYAIHSSTGQSTLPVVSVFSNSYSSSNVTDTALVPGTVVTFEVNVADAPSFNGYEFVLYYDSSFIQATTVDVRTGTVFTNPFVALQDLAVPGIIRLSVVNLGSSFDGAFGSLVHLAFRVVDTGVSPLVLAAGTANPANAAESDTRLVLGLNPIAVSTSDGYFKNVAGKLGPVAAFTFLPAMPLKGSTVFFNATDSFDADFNSLPDRGLSTYTWDFGDGQGQVSIFPFITHRFGQPQMGGADYSGNFSIRLTVKDTDEGFVGIRTLLVPISPTAGSSAGVTFNTGPTLSTPAGSSVVSSILIFSVGGFIGTVGLTSSSFPVLPNGLSTALNPTSVSLVVDGTAHTVLTTTAKVDTPPGRYVVVIRASSGSVAVGAGILFVEVQPREPIFGSAKFAWTRKISVSSNPLETWRGQVANPNPVTPLQVRLHITGTIAGVPIFTSDSATILLSPGGSQFLTATRLFPSYQAGLTFGFTATIFWSFVPGTYLVSSSRVTGTIMVSK